MNVRVLYFQSLKDRAGSEEEAWEMDDGTTVEEAADVIFLSHPELERMRRSILFAVNEEWCAPDRVLVEGDTLALMPPVSGG